MARDAQTVTIGSTSSPDNTKAEYIQLEGGGIGILPYSRMVFRGSFALNGSAVADTADCRITLPLPSNNVWQLDQFFFGFSFTPVGASYDQATLELYAAPSTTAFGQSTQLDYSCILSSQTNVAGLSGFTQKNLRLATQVQDAFNSDIASAVPQADPFRLISFNDESGGADPVIWLGSGTQTNIDEAEARIFVTFLGYTQEQMSRADLWTGFNFRG